MEDKEKKPGNATVVKIGDFPGDFTVKLDAGGEVPATGDSGYGPGVPVGTRCQVGYVITEFFTPTPAQ